MKRTDELVHELKTTSNILDFLEKNTTEMQLDSLSNYLNQWLITKNRTKADVVRGLSAGMRKCASREKAFRKSDFH